MRSEEKFKDSRCISLEIKSTELLLVGLLPSYTGQAPHPASGEAAN
jgi:hypothetical protein